MSMFDTRCRDLAKDFLMDEEDVAFEENIDDLALEIQHAMEQWLEMKRNEAVDAAAV